MAAPESESEYPWATPPCSQCPHVIKDYTLLPWSSALCSHIDEAPKDLRYLYASHLHARSTETKRCSWFVQARKAQEVYLIKEYTTRMKELARQKKKEEEEARAAKRRAEGYTCRRCCCKFDSNTKLHKHIRTRHAKKPKHVVSLQSATSPKQASLVQASQASSTSSSLTPPPTRSPTPTGSSTLRPSRIPVRVASLSHSLPPSPPSTPPPHITAPKQKPYLTVDDLHKMFAGKPRPTGLQQHQVPVPGTRQLPLSRDTRSTTYVAFPFQFTFPLSPRSFAPVNKRAWMRAYTRDRRNGQRQSERQ